MPAATFDGPEAIAKALGDTAESTRGKGRPRISFELEGDVNSADGVTDSWFTFETAVGRGKGHVRLKEGKCWTLFTTLQELRGHEEQNDAHGTRPKGVAHGTQEGRLTWLEQKQHDEATLGHDPENQPYVLIVGGGQGAIALAARLKQLSVPTIVVEKNERAGDSWRKRYRSLCLHDPVWYDHLPYLNFPDHWPIFSPKDKVGDWLEMYTKIMELNYWSSTTVMSASYDDEAGRWVVAVANGSKVVTLRPTQLVMATGMS